MKIWPRWSQPLAGIAISAAIATATTVAVISFFPETFHPDVDQEMRQAVSKIMATEELAAIYGPSKQEYKCIDYQIRELKREKSLDALLVAFHSCDESLTDAFGPLRNLSDALRFGAFLTLVSSRIAPYGSSDPNLVQGTSKDIITNVLGAASLNCAPQMVFVASALKSAYPDTEVRQIGINSKAINHAMVFASDESGSLLLDPTTSVIAHVQLSDILEGKPASIYEMIDFYEGNDELLEQFRRKLRGALRNGAIRRNDVIYDIPL